MRTQLHFNHIAPGGVTLPFLLAAPFFGALAAALLLWAGDSVLLSRWQPELIGAIHVYTIGFLLFGIAGALLQIGPVLTAQPSLQSNRIASRLRLMLGAGAVVFRDQRMLDLVSLRADYVFDPERNAPGYREKFRQLGRYILEGSKSGAAAAAVYVSQRVMPPHRDGLGRVIRETIHATEYLYDRVARLAEAIASDATLIIPVEPDSNLLCLAMNPADNTSLAEANRFTRAVFATMKVDASVPV